MKLNLGCGRDYREGWVNVDSNSNVRSDFQLTLGKEALPIKNDSVDEVFMSHSLEHIENFWPFIEDLYRVCRHRAKIKIIVPHVSGYAECPQHYSRWSVCSFQIFDKQQISKSETGERYGTFVCRVDRIQLHWWSHYGTAPMRKFQWIGLPFELLANNFGFMWLLFAERWPFGWSEIEYELTVIKENK